MPRGAITTEVLGPFDRERWRLVRDARAQQVGEDELPALRPRSVGELLDMSFETLRARFGTCMALSVPLWLGVQALQRVLVSAEGVTAPEMADVAAMMSQGAIAAAVRALTMALVTLVVYGYVQGRRVSAGQALRACRKRAPGLLALTVIKGIGMFFATACGAVCLFAPTIALSWLWAVAPAALVLEGVSPADALSRSMSLARKGFLRWAGVMVTQFCLTFPLLAAVGVLGKAFGINVLFDPNLREQARLAVGLHPAPFAALDLVLSAFILGFGSALTAVVLTTYYLDQRVRVEGFDLDMGLERLRAAGPGGRSSGAPAEGRA